LVNVAGRRAAGLQLTQCVWFKR